MRVSRGAQVGRSACTRYPPRWPRWSPRHASGRKEKCRSREAERASLTGREGGGGGAALAEGAKSVHGGGTTRAPPQPRKTARRGEEGSPDSPRWPSPSPDARTHARIVFRVPTPNLSLSKPVHCAPGREPLSSSTSSSSSPSRGVTVFSARALSRAYVADRRGASGEQHRIRWVDAYESPGARARVRFSCARAHRRVDALTHINPWH